MKHIPVLPREIIEFLEPRSGETLLDATVGHGGHAKLFLEATADTRVIGIDADVNALSKAQQELAAYGSRVELKEGTFAQIEHLVGENEIHHALFDLGIGSHQLADPARGFSFESDAPLTMRYGTGENLPPSSHQAVAWVEKRLGHAPDADELIALLSEEELANIIWVYGEERMSRRIAKALKRGNRPTTARELADTIKAALPQTYERGRIHAATRTFQALRLVVNRELESLETALPQATRMLTGGGKLAVISFHSLEDRIVKQFMRSETSLHILTKKPVQASREEIKTNPRSRSAKLRVAQKLNNQKQTHDSKHFTTRNASYPH